MLSDSITNDRNPGSSWPWPLLLQLLLAAAGCLWPPWTWRRAGALKWRSASRSALTLTMRSCTLIFAYVLSSIGVVNCGKHEAKPFLGLQSAYSPTLNDSPPTPFASVVHQLSAQASMNASPMQDSTPVVVEWAGVPPAHSTSTHDYILLSCNGVDWPLEEAFDAIRVPVNAAVSGRGTVELPPLPDLRCPYVLRYVRKVATLSGEILAEVELAHAVGGFGTRPQSLHIGFTGQRDEMLVIWISGLRDGQAQWGLSPGEYTHVVDATSSTYVASDLCNAPANRSGPLGFIDPGMIHRAVLTKLPPSALIYYRVRSGSQAWGAEHSFRSRQSSPVLNGLGSVRFLMYADQALPVPFIPHVAWRMVPQVVRDIEAGYDAFLLHPGDLGYAMGQGYIWDVWGKLVEPISSRVPYMVTVGNHEYDHTGSHLEPSGSVVTGWHPSWGNYGDDSRGECGVPTAARFNGTGSAAPGSNHIFWYSFEEGPVHVIVLSSEHDWTVGSRQYTWLAADLATVDRAVTPWVVLATHRMMYAWPHAT